MKFVRLTNLMPGYLDEPVFLNVDHIIAVHSHVRPSGGIVTVVFTGEHGIAWEVEEGLTETIRKIEEAANDSKKETS